MVALSAGPWADIGTAGGAALVVCTLIGLAYKFVLLPNLRAELRPTRESNRELTGGPNEPSIRELIDELAHKHDQHTGEIEDAALELRAMALMFDGHLAWAQEEVDRLRAERQAMVDAIWTELDRQRATGVRPDSRHKHRKATEDE